MTLSLLENSIAAAFAPETPSAFSQMAEAENEFQSRIVAARKKVAELDEMKGQMSIAAFAAKETALASIFEQHLAVITREQQTIDRLRMELEMALDAHQLAIKARDAALESARQDHDAHSALMTAAWEQEYKIATRLQAMLEAALIVGAKETSDAN
jgi:predicted metal-dependent HD superfamily phosphohydrolase